MNKIIFLLLTIPFFFIGCAHKEPLSKAQKKIVEKYMPDTPLKASTFKKLPAWNNEEHGKALENFIYSCKSKKTQDLYSGLCQKANEVNDPKLFFEKEFRPFTITANGEKKEGLLTGYYEPQLHGSREKTQRFKYPVYATPEDLIIVDLDEVYPELKHLRLRGKLLGNRLVPYDTREDIDENTIAAEVICYVDSKIDLFFLEVQGSGRVLLDDGTTIFVAYHNQNGHKYTSIGKYLIKIGALTLEEVSLQSIKKWLLENPSRVDEVLNQNDSVVYFKEDDNPASGSLGLCLNPKRSIAVDRKYIPLGAMLYLDSKVDGDAISQIVLAQDTGGAIKGSLRADLFLGHGKEAMNIAGKLKSPLKMWVLLPRQDESDSDE